MRQPGVTQNARLAVMATPRAWVTAALLGAFAVLVMLLTSGQMADLRVALPPLSAAMNWLEFLPVPFDMDHVVFFALLGMSARVLLPRLRWWWLLAGFAVLAAGTELLQFLTVGRTPKLLDARDDLVGASVGILLGAIPLAAAPVAKTLLGLSAALVLSGVVLLPFQQWPVAIAFGFPVLPADVAFALALAIRGFALATGAADIRIAGVHGWLLAYVLAMLLAALVIAPAQGGSAGSGIGCAMPSPSFLSALGKWIGTAYLAALAVLVCDAVSSLVWRQRLLKAWLAGACIAALAGWIAIVGYYAGDAAHASVAPWLSHYGSLPSGFYPRIKGLFANANMFGFYLVLCAGVALAAHEEKLLSRRRLITFLAAIALPLAATGSPAFAATILLLAWWWHAHGTSSAIARRVLFPVAALLALANIALLLVNPEAPFRAPSVRLQVWQEAWLTWQGAPWRGIGLGQPVAHVVYRAPDGAVQYLTDAHDIILNLGAQGGVFAVAAFTGLMLWCWRTGRDPAPARAMRAGVLLAVVYLGIGGSFEDARVLWVAMGLLAGMAIADAPARPARVPAA